LNIWFTSDQHFGHNMVAVKHRGFPSSVEMDEALIAAWNQMVRPNDDVWQLGDFSLLNVWPAADYLRRLNGRINIVPGGHDKQWVKKFDPGVHNLKTVLIHPQLLTRSFSGHKITLCHYPMRSWEQSHYGKNHFHGHTHGNSGISRPSFDLKREGLVAGWAVDVGVDVWNLAPVELGTLLAHIDSRKGLAVE
jgi:calcineurin-like phosphoesterase family protein